MKKTILLIGTFLAVFSINAQVSLPNFFSDHMVLQRNNNNPIWGNAKKGEKITVSINGQSHKTKADKNGYWKVKLNPMKAGGPFVLTVKGKNTLTISDVLIGEVWLCSGQSNMGWRVSGSTNANLEIASANFPNIRLLKTPTKGNLIPQKDLDTKWEKCSPETIGDFSANGYYFGRKLYHTLGVPIGLINVAWGASAIETWIPRDAMDATNEYTEMLAQWDKRMSNYTDATYEKEVKKYDAWKKGGKKGKKLNPSSDHRIGQNTSGNGFNNMVNPLVGYGIKGAIWCQGETNIGRAYQYRSLMPLLINTWRKLWKQGDFPFYWIQIAGKNARPLAPKGSMWAELREAQSMALSLPNTGEAIVYDLGEENNIHFGNKQASASRLVLHALSKDYGYKKLAANSPRYESMLVEGNKITITFKNVSKKLFAFDSPIIKGFSIAGKDKKFVWAKAKIIGKNKVVLYADEVINPVAVRYAWQDNPDANLFDSTRLPVTGFRTDDWPGLTVKNKKANR